MKSFIFKSLFVAFFIISAISCSADDVGRSDDYRVHSLDVIKASGADHGHDSFRGAGAQRRYSLAEPSDVVGMEAVYVLRGNDSLDDLGGGRS